MITKANPGVKDVSRLGIEPWSPDPQSVIKAMCYDNPMQSNSVLPWVVVCLDTFLVRILLLKFSILDYFTKIFLELLLIWNTFQG